MRFKIINIFVGLAVWAAASSAQVPAEAPARAPAQASAQAPAVKAELSQFLVVQEGGKEVLKPAGAVKPGDLIEYRVVYTNQSARPVRDMVADLPIPARLEYQATTARPRQDALATADGLTYGPEPLMRELPGGKKEAVPLSQYRGLRWTVGLLEPGAKAEVSARARVPAATEAAQVPAKPPLQTPSR